MNRQEWTLSRNCSISPRQLALAYAALCFMSLLVATIFTVHGAWYVLGFAIVEVSAVGWAFFIYARHATDREHIELVDDCLVVELIQIERIRQYKLNPHRTLVDVPESPDELIGLEANGTRVEVGRFLTEQKKHEFAHELRRALASAK
ncbi:DUF2244 domain-containing protein [Noviherbaspirillum cavernae]|uniref:DUF2244 domain-containing protein n=2 Tax=Noviherbaspirillum cavernae TaxID=2320862 RepID=A0A418X5X1_9BURK|nr:DUF2244 domain-containing protein [Noviherbaspirillum cavernae]RJG07776.1 DUF2244 domain-containing protein [Noviherbaspirillum cavernae]